jgi:hypothetical protein
MKQTLASLTNLSRLAPQSHFMSLAKAAEYENLSAYSPTNILAWLKNVGLYWLGAKHPFLTYAAPSTGIFPMDNQVKISVAGDWGSGTNEAEKVAAQIRAGMPDFTIHLGDVYYTGNKAEIDENFLGIKSSAFDPTAWPLGSKGTFSLLGNHEMFSHGTFYFDVLLPALKQQASYFCLENDFWRIVAIDTGYNSTGLDFGPFKPSCKIPDEVLTWLASLNLAGDDRGLIVMSHHQPWSSFETWYKTPAKQLAKFINRPVLWFWGHEHRMAIYGEYTMNGITARGRLIGHGGMPITLKKPNNSKCFCAFTDMDLYPNSEGLSVGFNGYATLEFSRANLHVDYLDLNGHLVYSEAWTPAALQ